MLNKFKLKKKLVSIALALALAAQPLASFPMQVFAGTGKNGVMEAPLKADVKELTIGSMVSSKYIVSKSVAFSDKNVLNGREIQGPGIVYAQEKIGSSTRDVYIIADINGILSAAYANVATAAVTATDVAANNVATAANAAANAANAASFAATAAGDAAYAASGDSKLYVAGADAARNAALYADAATGDAVHAVAGGAYGAARCAADAAKAALYADAAKAALYADAACTNAAGAAAYRDTAKNAAAKVIQGAVQKAIDAAFSDYTETYGDAAQKAAAGVIQGAVQKAIDDAFQNCGGALSVSDDAKKACDAAKTALEKGLNLESKLKTAYMAYKLAENIWSQLSEKSGASEEEKANYDACQKIANTLKEVIDRMYSDKVGDIEAQAKKA